MTNALGLPGASGCIDDLTKSIHRIAAVRQRDMIADQTGGHAGLLRQRIRLIGREDQADRSGAHYVTELGRTEKGRKRYDDLARHRAAELSNHPIDAIWRENPDRFRLRPKIGSKAHHFGEELAAMNGPLAIAHGSSIARLISVAVHRVKQSSHEAILNLARHCHPARGEDSRLRTPSAARRSRCPIAGGPEFVDSLRLPSGSEDGPIALPACATAG